MKYFLTLIIFLLPVFALAAAPVYNPMVGIPGVSAGAPFNDYINVLYGLSISIAALLAVIKIVIAGVKYMLTDVVTSKGEAKQDIYSALIGLVVVLGAVLILNIINPNLTRTNLTLSVAATARTPAPTVVTTTFTKTVSDLRNGVIMHVVDGGQTPEQIEAFKVDCIRRSGSSLVGGVLTPSNWYSHTLGTSDRAARCTFRPPGVEVFSFENQDNAIDKCTRSRIPASPTDEPGLGGRFTVDLHYLTKGWCTVRP